MSWRSPPAMKKYFQERKDMPQAQASIVISGDIDHIFTITNDIERWPELFREYNGAKVLSNDRYDRFAKLVFQLTNQEGETWQSWRILDFQEHIAIAQRGAPMYPFKYMHLTWSYETVEEGVKMTWVQDFEVDPKFPLTNEQVLKNMHTHMQKNQEHFKEVLENQFGTASKA
jgi:aromatase